jgi:hypothetical protein
MATLSTTKLLKVARKISREIVREINQNFILYEFTGEDCNKKFLALI